MAFLLALVVLLIAYQLLLPGSVFREIRADIKRRRQSSRDVAERLAQLHNLTGQEREVLRVYVLERVYECLQNPQDAVIRRLVDRGILRPVQSAGDGSAFSVAAWTRSYLISRPELLA